MFLGTRFGFGVYFARDASYSMKYSQPDSNGYCYMYVARVLVGKFTAGEKGMKAPPSRNDPNNPGLLYNSVVNNVRSPYVFVTFLDHQCYPEYLITLTRLPHINPPIPSPPKLIVTNRAGPKAP